MYLNINSVQMGVPTGAAGAVVDRPQITYFCRNCGFSDQTVHASNVSISKVQVKPAANTGTFYGINEYTKEDPTLPRLENIQCPRADCPSRRPDGSDGWRKPEVTCVRYDLQNLRYAYLCCVCDAVWTNHES